MRAKFSLRRIFRSLGFAMDWPFLAFSDVLKFCVPPILASGLPTSQEVRNILADIGLSPQNREEKFEVPWFLPWFLGSMGGNVFFFCFRSVWGVDIFWVWSPWDGIPKTKSEAINECNPVNQAWHTTSHHLTSNSTQLMWVADKNTGWTE